MCKGGITSQAKTPRRHATRGLDIAWVTHSSFSRAVSQPGTKLLQTNVSRVRPLSLQQGHSEVTSNTPSYPSPPTTHQPVPFPLVHPLPTNQFHPPCHPTTHPAPLPTQYPPISSIPTLPSAQALPSHLLPGLASLGRRCCLSWYIVHLL